MDAHRKIWAQLKPKNTPHREIIAPKRRKMIPKSRNKALHIEKKAPIRGENSHGFFHMSKNDYQRHNIFENYLSHNYVKIHSRLHIIKLFLKKFLGRAYPQIPSSKIDRRYTHRTTTQAECITILQYLSIISKIIPPYLNFNIFFIKNLSFRHPTPPPP